jgi:hypothetical protein
MGLGIFVLVQKDCNAKKASFAARTLKDSLPFTTRNRKSKKEIQSVFITTILCFPEEYDSYDESIGFRFTPDPLKPHTPMHTQTQTNTHTNSYESIGIRFTPDPVPNLLVTDLLSSQQNTNVA